MKRTTVKELLNLIKKTLPYNLTIQNEDPTPGDQFGIYSNFSNTRKVKVKPTILTKLVESCMNVLSKIGAYNTKEIFQ